MARYPNKSNRVIFNPTDFGITVHRKVLQERLTLTAVTQATGVPLSSVARITTGKPPTIDNFIALLAWGGWDARQFMMAREERVARL